MVTPDESSKEAPSLRVLCLHASDSNAAALSGPLETLAERLYERHRIDLVYVQSPLISKDSNAEGSPERVWWTEEGEEDERKYVGLDAVLLLLRQMWTSMPFCGILAVDHGAAVASFLPFFEGLPSPPLFCIFINGTTLLPDETRLSDDDLESLHIWSE